MGRLKWFIFGIIVTLLAVAVFGNETDSSLLTFQNNTEVNLNILCVSSGQICDNTFLCELNASYPNYTLLNSGIMSFNSSGYYNYSLGNLTQIGDYHASVTCSKGGSYGTSDASFRVANLLKKQLETNDMFLSVMIAIFGSAAIFGYLASKFADKHFPLQILFMSLCLMFLGIGFSAAISITSTGSAAFLPNILGTPYLASFYTGAFIILYFMMYFVVKLLMNRIEEKKKLSKELRFDS